VAIYVEVLMDTLYAYGAYGREPVKADWTNGLDFKIGGGPYLSLIHMSEPTRQIH
jgi:hypothetical protein